MASSSAACLLGLLGLLIANVNARVAPTMAPGSRDGQRLIAPGPKTQEELNLLFIQQIQSGRLVMDRNSSQKGELVLNGVSRHTIWFADRPGRSAGQVETSFFVGSNFTDANGDWLAKPNAALYISKPGPRASTDIIVIVTLSKPVFNETSGTLSYKADIIPGTSTLGSSQPTPREGSLMKSYLQVAQDPTTPTLVSEFKEGELVFDSAVLFIDHWGWWGGGWGWRWCGWGWGWCGGWGWGK